MSTFNYKAIRSNGESYTGELSVDSKEALYEAIKKDGGRVVSVTEGKKSAGGIKNFLEKLSRVKEHEKITFAKNLGSMNDAGLSVTRALTVMERQTKNPRLKKIIIFINQSVAEGKTLSDSMAHFPKVFSPLFVSMVRAGEESGSLSESLEVVSIQMDKTYLLKKKIKGAFMYPIIIFILMIVIAILMLVFIVPTLSATFTDLGVKLPLSTRSIIGMSNFLKYHYLISISIAAVVIGSIFYAFRTVKGKHFFDWLILHIPFISVIVKQINSARTARTLSSLLASGVDMVVALSITQDVLQNSYYKPALQEVEEKVQKGENMSTVFSKYEKIFPVFITEMISVGEETGKLSEMLLNVAEFYEREVEQSTKDISTIIEPLLMVIIGVGVGFFAISMISPMYSLADAI